MKWPQRVAGGDNFRKNLALPDDEYASREFFRCKILLLTETIEISRLVILMEEQRFFQRKYRSCHCIV